MSPHSGVYPIAFRVNTKISRIPFLFWFSTIFWWLINASNHLGCADGCWRLRSRLWEATGEWGIFMLHFFFFMTSMIGPIHALKQNDSQASIKLNLSVPVIHCQYEESGLRYRNRKQCEALLILYIWYLRDIWFNELKLLTSCSFFPRSNFLR